MRWINTAPSPQVGLFVRVLRPQGLAELIDLLGVDFVIIDTEHEAWNPESLSLVVGLAGRITTRILVRVPDLSYAEIARPIDDGADGVVVPRVESAADAATAVRAARHPPYGKRGVSVHRRLRESASRPLPARIESLDRSVAVVLQIETPDGVKNIDEIAATPGIDAILVGLSDLSSALGGPSELTDATIVELVEAVRNSSEQHGLAFGVAGSTIASQEWARRGASIVIAGVDSELVLDAVQGQVRSCRQAIRSGGEAPQAH